MLAFRPVQLMLRHQLPTRAEVLALVLERIWNSLDEAMTALEESEAKHATVRDELTARVVAMGNGTWPLP